MPASDNQSALPLGIIVHPHYWDFAKYPFRGIDRYNDELIKGLRRQGVALEVYDSGYIKTNAEGALKELLFPFRFSGKRARCFFAPHSMGAKWALLLGKRPVVTVIQDLLPFAYGEGQYDSAAKYFFKRRAIELAAKQSDRLIVAYGSTKQEVVERFKVDPAKIVVIPYGIDHERFVAGPVRKNTPRRVFFLGEALRAKGADTALRAFKLLRDRLPDVELKMGSRGAELEQLKRLAHELGIADRTEFLGRIPDDELPLLYRSADVFVFPSRHGFGLPTIEAMASGVPTVSGRIFDAIDFVGEAGLLADPNDPSEVAECLWRLLTDDALWLTYRERGLARARQFSWDRMAKETLEVCEAAVREHATNRSRESARHRG
jgi:glycosyltransferase involved in cell wall biosynthesis